MLSSQNQIGSIQTNKNLPKKYLLLQTKPNQTKMKQNETKQKTMSMINKTTNTQGRIDVTGGTYCFVDCNILYIF